MKSKSKVLTHGFTPLFHWVMENPELSNSEAQIVCRVLLWHEGGCRESNATIGRQLKMDPRTVRRLVKELVRKEWLAALYPTKYRRLLFVAPKRLVALPKKLLTTKRRGAKQKISGEAGDAKDTKTKIDLAEIPILKLIKQGESQALEFKETLEYDTGEEKKNKDILHSSLKTIASFLNAAGGALLIGVQDSGKMKGIERDLRIMNHGNKDRFEQKIRNCLKDRFKPQPIGKVNISFEEFTEGTICRVDVQASKEIIHLDGKVYVREGNTTLLLEGPTLTDWIQQRGN